MDSNRGPRNFGKDSLCPVVPPCLNTGLEGLSRKMFKYLIKGCNVVRQQTAWDLLAEHAREQKRNGAHIFCIRQTYSIQ
jgi:hypothetical protein